MNLGIYISVPFCKTKCSYCNFASGVFSKQVFRRYVDRVAEDVAAWGEQQIPRGLTPAHDDKTLLSEDNRLGLDVPREVDSIYLGGGTPTLLEAEQLKRLFAAVRDVFSVIKNAEITVECAPGTLSPEVIETLLRCGVNRVSLGVQSFIDKEASSVARLHTRAVILEEIATLRSAGIDNISIDLIAGLPHQTQESWNDSLSQLIDIGVPHASVYMLEVDEDSRLGRELIAGGTKYHAHFVPDGDLTAELYERACERLGAAGISQYEISNFAREGWGSKHNLKYWTRQPYLGFGVDAHSMVPVRPEVGFTSAKGGHMWGTIGSIGTVALESVRFATTDNLEQYVSGAPVIETPIDENGAIEEAFFLGLRLNRGVDLEQMAERYGTAGTIAFREEFAELASAGLVEVEEGAIRLTNRGRLLSNEVFSRLIDLSVQPK